jgi:V/A-type H+-transporting ATPase subunit A
VVRIIGDLATIQVYEDTTMLKPGAKVLCTGAPLSVSLGPGLVGNIYDGIQRPLPGIEAKSGTWIRRGEKVEALDNARRWTFEPLAAKGDTVGPGQVIGQVVETPLVTHRIMVPPDVSGSVLSIAGKGDYTLLDPGCCDRTPEGRKGK